MQHKFVVLSIMTFWEEKTMVKRFITLVCVIFTLLSFSGCGNNTDTDNGQSNMTDDNIVGRSLNNDAMEYQNMYRP